MNKIPISKHYFPLIDHTTDLLPIPMAKSQAVTNQTLKKLEDQLTCAICLDTFKDPKLHVLQCFNVCCNIMVARTASASNWWSKTDKDNSISLCCPTCRHSTLLLTSSQHSISMHYLFEIQDVAAAPVNCVSALATNRPLTTSKGSI